MAFDNNNLAATLTSSIDGSFNDLEDNSVNVDASATDSFNTDASTNDNSTTEVGIVDSGNVDSGNTAIDIEDSGNTFDFTAWVDASDNSVNDDSINAGVRSYNLGFDGASFGGAAGAAGGDVLINNQNTVVDQSVSGNYAVAGDLAQEFANSSVTASGDDSVAAGGDVTVTTIVDQSTSIDAEGDVLIDSTKTENWAINSGNSYDFDYSYTDESVTVDVADSFNDYSLDVGVTDSFNDESLVFDYTDVDVTVDAIVDSTVTDIGDITL